MHVDHLTYAAGPDGLHAAVAQLEAQLGASFRDGGFHPRFGTRNHILPLQGGRYLEVVEVLDHPAAERAVYGQAVRARSEMGGGWLGWVISVDDLTPFEERLERRAVPGSRHFPDGRLLEWEQIGVRGLLADPQLPYFLKWESPEDVLPTALPADDIQLSEIEISGSRKRVEDWIGQEIDDVFDGVNFAFEAEHGHPGIIACTFQTAQGTVRI